MTEPRTFAGVLLSNKRQTTRREPFLTEMDQVIPWATVEALVEPHDPKAGRDRSPLLMATMRRFAHLDFRHDTVPDETTIGKCRHPVEA